MSHKIRVQLPAGTSSASVGGVEYDADKDGIVTLDNHEHVGPLVRHGGVELGKDGAPGTSPSLIGSDRFPATIELPDGAEPRQLGDIVAEAHQRTGLSIDEWNNLPQIVRDFFIDLHIRELTGEIGDVAGLRDQIEQLTSAATGRDQIIDSLRASIDKLRGALKAAGGDPDKLDGADDAKPDFNAKTKAEINEWLTANGGKIATGDVPAHVAAAEARWAELHPAAAGD